MAVQAAALNERVRQLETLVREVERRVTAEIESRERRLDKTLDELQVRFDDVVTRASRTLADGLAARVTIDEFRPYKLISWILGAAVLLAAIPTLSQSVLPTLLKAIFKW